MISKQVCLIKLLIFYECGILCLDENYVIEG